MKIVYIANARMPTEKAHGLQIMSMCHAFTEHGVEIELILPTRFNSISQNPYDYYGVHKSFKIKYLPSVDLVARVPVIGFWIQLLTFWITSRFYLLFADYDLVYTRDGLFAWGAKRYWLELHSIPHKLSRFYFRIWQRAEKIVALTTYIKSRLTNLGINEDRIIVAPDGVDLDKFSTDGTKTQARRRLKIEEDKFIIGYIGELKTMGQEKGLTTLFQSLKFLPSHCQILIVGGIAKDISEYAILLRNMGIEGRVKFIGHVPHRDVEVYQKACDVLVAPFPKTEHYEFFMSPMKIFEYMASGRPIIASDLPSLREVLNEQNCLFIKPGDARDLADKILTLQSNRQLGEQLAKQALADVKQYDWSTRAKRILESLDPGL